MAKRGRKPNYQNGMKNIKQNLKENIKIIS